MLDCKTWTSRLKLVVDEKQTLTLSYVKGGEYINYTVAQLLKKLHIEFTKYRPRRSNDNGLVESKNGSVVRKL